MAAPRRLFHVDMIIDSSVLWEMMLLAEGRAFDVKVNAIHAPEHLNGVGPSGRTSQVSARSLLLPWMLQQDGEIAIKAAIVHAEEHSVSRAAVYTMFNKLLKEKLAERAAPGVFVLSDKGKETARSVTNGAAAPANGKTARQKHDITNLQFVMKLVKKGKATYSDIKKAFGENGRNPKSVDGAVGKLRADKMLTGNGTDGYKLTARGSAAV